MNTEAPNMGLECGERRRAAHVCDPRPERRLRRDLGDRTIGNAEEDELRRRRVEVEAALREPRTHR